MVKSALKLSSEERRTAIIRAVRKVFAEKGFHGTTTRALPTRQGYPKRFCSSIFRTKRPCIRRCSFFAATKNDPEKIDRIKALEPSTSTLVLIVHLMVARTVGTEPEQPGRRGHSSSPDAPQHDRGWRVCPTFLRTHDALLDLESRRMLAGLDRRGRGEPRSRSSQSGGSLRPAPGQDHHGLAVAGNAHRRLRNAAGEIGRASRLVHSPRFGCKR